MNYKEITSFVHGSPVRKTADSLDSIIRLLNKLDNPQKGLKCIHIAGTNGKGSTSSFLSNILMEAGYKVGFLVSPYIHVFNERFQINNDNISDEKLSQYVIIVKEACEKIVEEGFLHPIQFEINTAIGFLYFKESACDAVILEVGIGGTYDATNIITDPILSIVTSISMDHTNLLGSSLTEIAKNKAGIIKKNHPVLIYDELESKDVLDVFINKAKKENSRLYQIDQGNISNVVINKGNKFTQSFDYENTDLKINLENITLNMLGQHQINNASLAIEASYIIKDLGYDKITKKSILTGLYKARWFGRFEILNQGPIFIIDGAHNIGGAEVLVKNLKTYFKDKKITFVLGFLKQKDYASIINIILPLAKNFYTYTPTDIRGFDGKNVYLYLKTLGVEVYNKKTPEEIIELTLENEEDDSVICALGTLYSVANFRDYFIK